MIWSDVQFLNLSFASVSKLVLGPTFWLGDMGDNLLFLFGIEIIRCWKIKSIDSTCVLTAMSLLHPYVERKQVIGRSKKHRKKKNAQSKSNDLQFRIWGDSKQHQALQSNVSKCCATTKASVSSGAVSLINIGVFLGKVTVKISHPER